MSSNVRSQPNLDIGGTGHNQGGSMERSRGQDGERGEPGVEQGDEDAEIQNGAEADRTGGGRSAEDGNVSRANFGLRGLEGADERRRRAEETTEIVSRKEGKSQGALGAAI